jgi:hypothetical protein
MKAAQNPNMMFTLDEEDEETEYGESFKSSFKNSGNRANFARRHRGLNDGRSVSEDEEEDDEDDDDFDPD